MTKPFAMNIAETRAPQDGRISLNISGREVDFRVSAMILAMVILGGAGSVPGIPGSAGRSLHDWLAYIESRHPKAIDMGLERVREVAGRLSLLKLPFPVITVGGTNGKGSTCAMLEAMLASAGHRTGCYTSPHLVHYNERVRVDRRQASDDELCDAFEAVENARGDDADAQAVVEPRLAEVAGGWQVDDHLDGKDHQRDRGDQLDGEPGKEPGHGAGLAGHLLFVLAEIAMGTSA